MYSKGKQELEKEKAKKYNPEEILALTKTINTAASETTKTLEEATRKLEKLKAQTDNIPQIAETNNAIRQLKIEVANLSASVNSLVSQKAENSRTEAEVLAKLKESLESAAIDQY